MSVPRWPFVTPRGRSSPSGAERDAVALPVLLAALGLLLVGLVVPDVLLQSRLGPPDADESVVLPSFS